MLLTDDLLLNYRRCQRRAFLNVYDQTTLLDPKGEFQQKLERDKQEHVARVMSSFPNTRKPKSPYHQWQVRGKQTEKLMEQGVSSISGGTLLHVDLRWPEVLLVSNPSLLIKQPGKSKFGDWTYLPVNIEYGSRPKSEYKIIAAFNSLLLAYTQGILPSVARIILRRRFPHTVDLLVWLPKMEELLDNCIEMLLQRQEPEVFISRQKCSLCHWYSSCEEVAQAEKHLSLVPGITPNLYSLLQAMGLHTLESIVTASLTDMGELMGMDIALGLQLQARSLVENRAILKPDYTIVQQNPIAQTTVELYFDIEAEQTLNLDYLLGVLVVNRQEKTEQFHSFLATKPEEEAMIWQEFLTFVNLYPNAPIFHFSPYEAETIQRLGSRYNTPKKQVQALLSRCVDLYQLTVSSVALPVQSYSLKSLANWLGFQWRDPGVRGERTVCWYDRWLKKGDRRLLEAILRYNEDDCRATYKLKIWLEAFFYNYSS